MAIKFPTIPAVPATPSAVCDQPFLRTFYFQQDCPGADLRFGFKLTFYAADGRECPAENVIIDVSTQTLDDFLTDPERVQLAALVNKLAIERVVNDDATEMTSK